MTYYKENLTKITFQQYDKTSSWETPFNDADVQDIIQGFVGCMCATSWTYDMVLDALSDYVEDHKTDIEDNLV